MAAESVKLDPSTIPNSIEASSVQSSGMSLNSTSATISLVEQSENPPFDALQTPVSKQERSLQKKFPNPQTMEETPFIPRKRSEALDAIIGRMFLSGLSRFLSGATSCWFSQPDVCQRVYYANHTSHLDILVIWSALPDYVRRYVRPVAAKDYWSKGIFKPYIASRLFNAILLERQHIKAHQNPIDDMLREMGNQYSIIIFPEGGRQSSGKMAEFKSGLYHMCKKRPELELIPIYIDNMNRILPRGTYLPVPLLSRVTFGSPIWLEENEKKNDFLERARQAVLDLKYRQS